MSQPSASLPHQPAPCAGLALGPWSGLVLSLLVGLVVWSTVQAAHPVFRVPKEYDVPSIGMPPELFARFRRQQDFVDRQHAMLYLGGLGLLVAAVLGLREGALRRSLLPPLVAPPLGAVGGALGGFLGCLVYEYVHANIGQADLAHTLGAQVAVAAPLGLGIGLGLGLSTRSLAGAAKVTLAGLAAGILAGVIFPVALSILHPTAESDDLLPDDATSRLLWLAILAGALGLVIPIAGRQRATKSQITSIKSQTNSKVPMSE
jgi:hypothetical protein